jgi:ligand-binding sensor domain-containing protein
MASPTLDSKSIVLIRSFSLLILLSAGLPSYGQPEDLPSKRIRFEQFPDDPNLSQNSINCMLQDHNGFLWMGTWSGLIQYNGYTTTVYHAGNQSGDLKSNQISALFEDSHNNLWVGTIKGGLYLYRHEQKRFIQFASTDKVNSLINDNVRAIQEDRDGNLWVFYLKVTARSTILYHLPDLAMVYLTT